MKSFALLALALSSLAGCVADTEGETTSDEDFLTTADAIVGGADDPGHPAVVAIRWDVLRNGAKTGNSNCTGTVIAPRTVLTAGHCVLAPDGTSTFANFRVFFGQDIATAPSIAVTKTIAHPEYNPGGALGVYDAAVVLLESDAPVKPLTFATKLPSLVGRTVDHVGFGFNTSVSRTQKSGLGKKRTATLPVTAQSDSLLRTGDTKTGICNGDSGGPALVLSNGRQVVVGVHSWVDDADTCLKNGYSTRTDYIAPFVLPYVRTNASALPPPGSAAVQLSWNALAGYSYSLDVITADGKWIGPCQSADILGTKKSTAFTGTCPSAANVAAPKGTLKAFRLYYSNTPGVWTQYVEVPYDGTANQVAFALPVPG